MMLSKGSDKSCVISVCSEEILTLVISTNDSETAGSVPLGLSLQQRQRKIGCVKRPVVGSVSHPWCMGGIHFFLHSLGIGIIPRFMSRRHRLAHFSLR